MPALKKPSKRKATLDAMLDLVVERGFHEAPVSLVAQRAGAGPGVIYHHFAGKQQIVQALFERVRALKRESILKGLTRPAGPTPTAKV